MKLLFVDSCISQRDERSRTRRLAEAFLAAFRESHPGAEIDTVDLKRLRLRHFDVIGLDDRDALAKVGAFDAPVFSLARQFREADRIVVAAPFWDLSFPAALRTYIEQISAVGLTYHYDADGCHGDCRAERLAYLTTGGDFEREDSLGVLYWRQLCAMFGIGQFDYVFAGGLDAAPDREEELLSAACDLAAKLAREF